MKKIYFLIIFALLGSTAEAQDIETDRPDQTETPAIVPKNRFQVEMGFSHQQTDVSDRLFTVPTALVKYGVNGFFEIRVEAEVANEKTAEGKASGLQPLKLGVKTKLWKEKGLLPKTSLLAQLQFPKWASRDFEVQHLAPEVRLLMSNTLSKKVKLSYNLGAEWDGERDTPEYVYTLSPNLQLSKKVKLFVEAYGFFQVSHHAQQWVDGGFMYAISKDVQLDISAGYELTATGQYHNFFESVGLSFRI